MVQAVITGLATLLGAGVGGFTTYFTSKAAFTRQEAAEAKRQHDALMRDVSVRFVRTLDTIRGEIGSSKFKELSARFDELVSSNQDVKNLFEQMKAGTATATPVQALEILWRAVEPTPPTLEQIAATTLRAAIDTAPQMAELNSIIAEMKLIMPTEILEKAQFAQMATLFVAQISEAMPPTDNSDQAASAAVSDFVRAVRGHLGLDLRNRPA